ncbi:uncharacterized protein LOC129284668 [Prosopis cineraria]|uniref:uncharacterized protein LOC129284668 n=1 Tax=Prosopis cineraria TaxID=364024 RepID=UPI00240FAA44|nr:uncharacterized protein LOC129284668 [Prosopis cineraria]
MDKEWMSANRLNKEYLNGVKEFMRFALEHVKDPRRIVCPCVRCGLLKQISASELEDHLVCYGIDENYKCWHKHGETREDEFTSNWEYKGNVESNDYDTDTYKGDCLEEMANAIERELEDCLEMLEMLKSDVEKPLYASCTEFTKLSAMLKLYNLKVSNGWSDKSFTENLTLIKQLLLANNELPRIMYEVKQMLRSIGMSYKKIHAYPNDCILFKNEYASLMKCPKCNAMRYKENGKSPKKALWYFSIVPRFRWLYSSAEDAKNLTWHGDERIKDGKLRHPANSSQWKKIDLDYPDFGVEDRNLRLILSTDGMNPHGFQSNSHSTWPVILVQLTSMVMYEAKIYDAIYSNFGAKTAGK